MPVKRNRRWPRFGVWPLIAVVILCLWFAPCWWLTSQWRIVQERAGVRWLIEQRGGYLVPSTAKDVNLVRGILGDEHVVIVRCVVMSAAET